MEEDILDKYIRKEYRMHLEYKDSQSFIGCGCCQC